MWKSREGVVQRESQAKEELQGWLGSHECGVQGN